MAAANIVRRTVTFSALAGITWLVPSATYAQVSTQEPAARVEARADSADDRLEDRLQYRLETDEDVRKYDIDVEVSNGVARLSGEVATQAQRDEAVRIAEDMDGVTRIEDQIEVDAKADDTLADRSRRGLSKTGDAIDDAWITTKVKWFFMGEDALEGSDINVDTNENVVTLKGTVTSEAGRARAKELAARTEGVKSVRDELTIAAAR
jgi:osmotically-inducible protein OsmY